MKKFLAQAFSILLHPVFMPLVACWLLFNTMPHLFKDVSARIFDGWIIMMIINTIIFPIITVLLLKGLGFIKSIHLNEPKERIIPLIATMVFYFWPYLVAKNVGVPDAGRMLLLGNFWGIILIFIATIFFKISWHTAGIGSIIGFSIALSIVSGSLLWQYILIGVALCLFIAWCRKALHAHTSRELILGATAGIISQLGAYVYIYII